MADVKKKASGYAQVKLIPADRSSQTWSGWTRRWIDLLLVKQDSGASKKEPVAEAWIEVRKAKKSGKPIKMWTIDAKDTKLFRCISKSRTHSFAIEFKGKHLVYLSGNSESESQEWMRVIRETLWPTNKDVKLQVAAGRLFEASIMDNLYSVACDLRGSYGHLTVRENKLIYVDHNGENVIQEWYLHTIRKLDVFRTTQVDTGRLLSIYLGENSSTGCGILYFFCPRAVLLLETIQATIREIFSNLEDNRKAQQATLMSLGALHDVSLEEACNKKDAHFRTISIADEIMKVKQELTFGGARGTPRMSTTTSESEASFSAKDDTFIWKDNELYEDVERADYTPELDQAQQQIDKKSKTQSLVVMTRPRANSCTLELDLPDLTKLKDHLIKRQGSLRETRNPQLQQQQQLPPQQDLQQANQLKGRKSLPTDVELEAGKMKEGLQSFRQVLNLSADSDNIRINEVCQFINESATGQKTILHETSETVHSVPLPVLAEQEETAEEVVAATASDDKASTSHSSPATTTTVVVAASTEDYPPPPQQQQQQQQNTNQPLPSIVTDDNNNNNNGDDNNDKSHDNNNNNNNGDSHDNNNNNSHDNSQENKNISDTKPKNNNDTATSPQYEEAKAVVAGQVADSSTEHVNIGSSSNSNNNNNNNNNSNDTNSTKNDNNNDTNSTKNDNNNNDDDNNNHNNSSNTNNNNDTNSTNNSLIVGETITSAAVSEVTENTGAGQSSSLAEEILHTASPAGGGEQTCRPGMPEVQEQSTFVNDLSIAASSTAAPPQTPPKTESIISTVDAVNQGASETKGGSDNGKTAVIHSGTPPPKPKRMLSRTASNETAQ